MRKFDQFIMKRSKYILLLLVSIVFYMLYTSTLLVNKWLVDLSPQPPPHYPLETKTTTQSVMLLDGQVGT